jgi:hypothetical protein
MLEDFLKSQAIKPVTIDGKEMYVVLMHPNQNYALKTILARDRYKHEMHIKRWERWSGKKYIEVEGELGLVDDCLQEKE